MTPFNEKKRLEVIARLAHKSPNRTLGRTKLMKLLYFLQELKGVPLGYDFRLFTYGPFDSDVLGDLATACNRGVVEEKTVIFTQSYGYEITLEPLGDRLSDRLAREDNELVAKIDEVVAEFGSFPAGELELRSTIVFIDRELHAGDRTATSKTLAEQVQKVKPHFDAPTIRERINDMSRRGWVAQVENA